MIEDIDFEALLGDKAFDIDWIRAELDRRGAAAVIPPKQNRKRMIECDFAMYGWRHLIENFRHIANPIRQDRLQLQRHDLSHQLNHRIAMNVHRP